MSAPDPEENRQLIAERLDWPPGALEAVRDLERRFPGWYVWWTDRPWRADGKVPDGACYGAAPVRRPRAGYSLFAPTAEELAGLIAAEAAR